MPQATSTRPPPFERQVQDDRAGVLFIQAVPDFAEVFQVAFRTHGFNADVLHPVRNRFRGNVLLLDVYAGQRKAELPAVPLDGELHLRARVAAHKRSQLGRRHRGHVLAVNGDNAVAGFHPRRVSGARNG